LTLLAITGLGCDRGDKPLFSNLSFDLDAGQLLHVTGPNGSGKTTLLRTLCGLSQPANGSITWQGLPINRQGDDYFAALHFVGHKNGIQGDLSAIEQLHFDAALSGSDSGKTAEEALYFMGLSPSSHLPTKVFSQGQQRRLALARLLITKKTLWILDEPFTALDHATVKQLEQTLINHTKDGGLVILTSHQSIALPDAKQIRLGDDNR
jgi:heme exporter protein A